MSGIRFFEAGALPGFQGFENKMLYQVRESLQMTKMIKKCIAQFTRAPLGRVGIIGVSATVLLFVATNAAADTQDSAEQSGTVIAPSDRAEALEFIRQAKARAVAESLAELRKELTPLEREWGVKILDLRMAAAGYLLNFRYKVLDAEKAMPLLNRSFNFSPFLLVEKSGAKLGVPFTQKAGSLRSAVSSPDQIQVGRNYSAVFANPGVHVHQGDKVSVIIGDFRAEHVAVQ
jgi:hypothetical protein